MNKQSIRKAVSEKRKALDQKFVADSSSVICNKLIELYPDKNLTVFSYMSLNNEVETSELLSYYKTVCLPVTEGTDISFYKYDGKLQKGNFGVLEPASRQDACLTPDLIVVPGVGFDKCKNRVGYGKGYYDGFLKKFPDVPKIGFAFSFQIFEKISDCRTEDIKLDRIITEKEDVL